MKRLLALILIPAMAIITLPARAADQAAELCRRAATAVESEKLDQAMDLLDQARIELWNKMPLTLRHTVLVKEPAQCYGLYSPRENNIYDSGETIYLYGEPVGVTEFAKDGRYAISLGADVALLDTKGTVLWGKRDFYSDQQESTRFNTEIYFSFNFDLSGLGAGKYLLEVTLRDKTTRGTAVFRQPLIIR